MPAILLSKDFLSGLLFVALGLFGLWLALDLEVGTSDAMAAGYFPRMICVLMIGVGAAVSVGAIIRGREQIEPLYWRPLILITVATIVFAALLKPFGLAVTVLIAVVLAGLAGPRPRILPLLVLALGLVCVTAGLFVFALRIPIPLWPSAL